MRYRWIFAIFALTSIVSGKTLHLASYQLVDPASPGVHFLGLDNPKSGINNANEIVGSKGDSAFFRSAAGVITTFDYPGGHSTSAQGINIFRQIVGNYSDIASNPHCFIREANGTFSTFDIPGASETYCYGINDAAQVVGTYVDAAHQQIAFVGVNPTSIATINIPHA